MHPTPDYWQIPAGGDKLYHVPTGFSHAAGPACPCPPGMPKQAEAPTSQMEPRTRDAETLRAC